MGRKDFTLTSEAGSALLILAPPAVVRIPLAGCRPVVAPGDLLPAGGIVGEPCAPPAPWVHTPVAGEVLDMVDGFVTVRTGPTTEPPVAAVDFAALSGAPLLEALARCGIDASALRPARHLIVNATPPEPAITITGRLLHDCRETLAKGLKLAKTLVSPTRVTVAGPNVDALAFGNCEVVRIRPRYPNGLDPLVIKAVTGQEHSEGVTVVGLLQLMDLGRVMETGRPLVNVRLTVQGRNVQAPVGTPLNELLAAVDTTPGNGDRAVLGGPMRGTALCRLDAGLGRDDYGLFVIPRDKHTPIRDAACLNCGECARLCPARIFPGELSMCAEAGLLERARLGHVESCFECGICGYVCPARRPLLQYLQLAKAELRRLDEVARNAAEAAAPQIQEAEEAE
ncbi:MAG: electron transporter RnfC [Desulfovibrio sp.]